MVNEIVLSILVFVSYNTGDQIIMVSQLILQMKNEFCGQKPDITDDNSTKQDKSCIFGGNFDMKPLKSENKMQMTNFRQTDRKSTRLNSSHVAISYAVFCL